MRKRNRLGTVSGTRFATGGLNQVLECINLTLAPNRYSYEQTSTSCEGCKGEITPTLSRGTNQVIIRGDVSGPDSSYKSALAL
jgi:hypothetical protein